MAAEPLKSVHTGQYLVEVWPGDPGETKYPRRLTVKVRPSHDGPFVLQRVRKFFTVEACDEALSAHGLTYLQPIVQGAAGPALRTLLVHGDTGQSIESECPLLFDGASKINPMQCLGSAITYARRYSLESLLGLLRDDDDGEGAYPQRRQQETRREEPPARQEEAKPASPIGKVWAWLEKAAESAGMNKYAMLNSVYGKLKEAKVAPEGEATNNDKVKAIAGFMYSEDEASRAEWQGWFKERLAEIKASHRGASA